MVQVNTYSEFFTIPNPNNSRELEFIIDGMPANQQRSNLLKTLKKGPTWNSIGRLNLKIKVSTQVSNKN